MKKFIIFLSLVLIILVGILAYLAGWPYLKEYLDNKNNQADANIIQGNYVGGTVNVEINTNQNALVEENTNINETSTEEIAQIVSNMTKDEIDIYNISFTGYEGQNMNGQMVKVLLEEVYRSNESNIGKPGLFVAVLQQYNSTIDELIGTPGDINNTESVVEDTNSKINALKYDTDSDGIYNIECIYDSGLVVKVKITKVE